MSVEELKSLFDIATVVLLGLTFFAGAGVLITGNIINRGQETKLRTFDGDLTAAKSDLAKQQERAAKAELSIALAEQHSSEANAKAEGFRLDIAKADEKTKAIETSNLALRGKVVTLETRAADAEKGVAALQLEANTQKERAAIAESKLIELQERVKIRRLSPEQRNKFVDSLNTSFARWGFKGKVRVTRLLFDESAQPLEDDIKDALKSAGWEIDEAGAMVVDQRAAQPVGIIFAIRNQDAIPSHGGTILKALEEAGLKPDPKEDPNLGPDVVEILIGLKP